jgi:hypothetical protein
MIGAYVGSLISSGIQAVSAASQASKEAETVLTLGGTDKENIARALA